MIGTVPKPNVPSDHYKHDPSDILKTSMEIVENKVRNVSEMEAVARVFLVVIDAVKDLPVTVQLQPSQEYHTAFTDFLFLLSDPEKEVCLIEVKKLTEFTTLDAASKSAAEAIREAHIILTSTCLEKLPFILTNGTFWSFGMAEKTVGNMIKVTETFDIYRDMSKLIGCLREVLQGNWLKI